MTDDVDEFLAHFGVKGMHWGVVHKPLPNGRIKKTPEMKTEERQVSREAKAQKYVKRAAGYQTQIDKINSQNHSWLTARSAKKQVTELKKHQQIALADAEKKRQGKLSSGQKHVVIGAAVVAGILATAVVYNTAQSGEFNRLAMKGQAAIKGKSGIHFAEREILSKKMSPDLVHSLVVPDINRGYGLPGTRVNCRRCTFAYELRRRGYDVKATTTTNSSGQTAVGLANALRPGKKIIPTGKASMVKQLLTEEYHKEVKPERHDLRPVTDLMAHVAAGAKNKIEDPSSKSILEALAKEPTGSRGELGVMWKMGGGHSMAYEIFDGKPVIFDTQNGKKLTNLEELASHGLDQVKTAGFTRLDNMPLNHDYLARWVKNA